MNFTNQIIIHNKKKNGIIQRWLVLFCPCLSNCTWEWLHQVLCLDSVWRWSAVLHQGNENNWFFNYTTLRSCWRFMQQDTPASEWILPWGITRIQLLTVHLKTEKDNFNRKLYGICFLLNWVMIMIVILIISDNTEQSFVWLEGLKQLKRKNVWPGII